MSSANVNASVNILVNTAQATTQIRALQAQVNSLNATLAQSGSTSLIARQGQMNKALADAAVASGMFTAKSVPMAHSIDAFSKSLDKGHLSLGQYTRGVMSQMPGMRRVFQREFDMMTRVAESRVKRLQTQYTALGNAQKALALSPTGLAPGAATATAMNIQKQMMFNKMVADGSTKLLNWGKNTQWAGRQLMVGFTLPLVAFGAAAAKTFMDLDRQARDFKRVYGDAFTPPSEIEANLKAVNKLGEEYTKYGIKLSDTMNIAATAAAAGMKNEQLMSGTEETLRLATIGQIDYQQALTTTISLQNAFKVSNEQLAPTVDFIGAIANQTVLTVDDMTKAIPRVAPVVAGLGGDIKDLAAMLVAMREGGVSAEQGANALKSGLASLINPTAAAIKITDKFGVNLNAIIQKNKGDLMGTVQAFGAALGSLDKFSRQQVLEKVFGKYQYARLGALFDNINQKAGQTKVALDLAGKSAEELGSLSAKSLREVEQSTTAKFQGAVERLKIAIAPVGEAFLKALTPIIGIVSKIAEKFNELPDGVKDIITKIAAFGGIVAPVVLMLAGLFGNMIANTIKGVQNLRKFFAWIKRDASAFNFLSGEELDAAAAARSLEGANNRLTESILLQQGAVRTLAELYGALAGQMSHAASMAGLPGFRGMPIGKSGPAPRKYAGGVTRVPGSGNGDIIPALLTPGESVVTKGATQKYAPIIAAMNAGSIKMMNTAGGATGKELGSPASGTYLTGRAKPVSPIAVMQPKMGNQSRMGVDRAVYSGEYGLAAFKASAKAAVDFAERMRTGARYSEKVLPELDQLDNLFEKIHKEVTSQLATSSSIDEAMDKSKKPVDGILREYIKQEVIAKRMTKDQAAALRRGVRLAMSDPATSARAGLARAERIDVQPGQSPIARTQSEQLSGAKGSPASVFKRLPKLTEREFARAGLNTPKDFNSWQRAHLRSVGSAPWITGLVPSKVQGTSSKSDSAAVKRVAQSYMKIGNAADVGANQGFGNASPSIKAQNAVAQYVDGIEVGAKQNLPQASGAGKLLGTAVASSAQQAMHSSANPLFAKTKTAALSEKNLPPARISLPKEIMDKLGPQPGLAKATSQTFTQGLKTTLDTGKTILAAAQTTKEQNAPLWKKVRQSIADVGKGTIEELKLAKQSQNATRKGIHNLASQQGLGKAGVPNLVQGIAPRSLDLLLKDYVTSFGRVFVEEAKRQGPAMKSAFSEIWTNMKTNAKVLGTEISTLWQTSGVAQSVKNIGNGIIAIPDKIRIAAGTAAEKITTMFNNAGTQVSNALKGVATKINGALFTPGASGMSRAQQFGRGANNASMGLMSVAMIGSFVEGPLQEFSHKLMMASMGLMVFQSLGLKASLVIAPLALFAGLIVKSRMDIDNLAKSAAKAGQALGGIPDAMGIISEATGFKFPTQQDNLFRFDEKTQKSMSQFSGFFEGERGMAFVKELKSVSSEERYQKVATMLQQAISSGLDPEKAKAFGQAIAKATGDYIMNSKLIRDFGSGKFNNRGGQGLIDIEKNRIAKYQPQLSSEAYRSSASSQTLINSQVGVGGIAGAGLGMGASAAIGAALGSSVPLIGTLIGAGIGALIGGGIAWLSTRKQQQHLDKVTGEAAKGLGFAMKTAENIANIEAVIADQRAKGLISYEEYAKQMAEVDKMQADQATYFKSLFAGGADNGALQQAMGDILTLRGFSSEQKNIVTEKLNVNTMAQDYFNKGYDELNKAQKDYISKVFEQVMTGLTPENVEQRMMDVEGTWKTISQQYMDAIARGVDPKTLFENINIENWANDTFDLGGEQQAAKKKQRQDEKATMQQQLASKQESLAGLEGVAAQYSQYDMSEMAQRARQDVADAKSEIDNLKTSIAASDVAIQKLGQSSAKTISDNITKNAEKLNKEFGVTKEQVMAVASSFKDTEFASKLLSTESGLTSIGAAISELKDYKNIDIELVIKSKNDPAKIAKALEKIGKININKKNFGNNYQEIQRNAIAAQDYVNILLETGDAGKMSAAQIADGYKGVITNLDKAADQAKKTKGAITKNGNFKVTTQLITTLFGGIINDSSQIATMINSALPAELDPMRAQILVSVMGNDAISNLFLANPKLLNALMTGKASYKEKGSYLGIKGTEYSYDVSVADTINSNPIFDAFGGYEGLTGLLGPTKGGTGSLDKPGGTDGGKDGGGAPEKTWLEQKMEEFAVNKALYESAEKIGKKLLKAKGSFFGLLEQLRQGQRPLGKNKIIKGYLTAPESMLEEIGAGPEGMKKIGELFKLSKEEFNKFVRDWQNNILGSKITELRGQVIKKNRGSLVEDILTGKDTSKVGGRVGKGLKRGGLKKIIDSFGLTQDQIKELMGDEGWVDAFLEAISQGNGKVKKLLGLTVKSFEDAANDIDTAISAAEDAWSKYSSAMDAGFSNAAYQGEQSVGADWLASNQAAIDSMLDMSETGMNADFYGTDRMPNTVAEYEDAMKRRVQLNEQMIQQEQEIIDKKQEQINDYQRTNDLIQQGIDDLNRQNELYNNRPVEALNHELEIMSQKENEIKKSYEDRIASLDKIASINQHILDQQKMQLGLADALSRGDIAAAAQAEQEQQAANAQYAVDQMRQGLQTGMDNRIAGLTTEDGFTRVQAEQQLNTYKENSYQISLKIRAEEDKIYANNLLVRTLTNDIYNINEDLIEPLTNQNNTINSMLGNLEQQVTYSRDHQIFMHMTTLEWEAQKGAHDSFMSQIESRTDVVTKYANEWERAAKAVSNLTGVALPADALPSTQESVSPTSQVSAETRASISAQANAAMGQSGGMGFFFSSTGGIVPQYLSTGGSSRGTDTVPAMLTPGEFVMRKRAVDQYGASNLARMNMGGFSMPRYSFAKNSQLAASGSKNDASASSPMYNTYSVNVNVPNTNADPDMIANKVMMKMAEVSRQNIRSTRGY